MVGDTNQDQIVNKPDYEKIEDHLHEMLDQMSGNYLLDLNLNGSINKADGRVIKSNKGHTVP